MIGRGLAVLAVLRVAFAVFVPVTPEEAYHWNFGQHLDWGYYDHPPMIAWAIRLGCVFFGDTALGIRSVPLLFALGTTALVARWSSTASPKKTPVYFERPIAPSAAPDAIQRGPRPLSSASQTSVIESAQKKRSGESG